MKIRNIAVKIIISSIITLLLIYFLLKQTDFKKFFILFKEINYFYIAISFFFYFLLTLVRSLRIKILARKNIKMENLFAIVLMNNFFTNLLPFRTGEISFPILLNKYVGLERKSGLMMLLYLRSLDLFVIILFIFVIVSFFSDSIARTYDISLHLIFISMVFVATLLFGVEKMFFFLNKISVKVDHSGSFFGLSGVIDGLLSVYRFYKSKFAITFVLSITIFILLIFTMGFALMAYPIGLSMAEIITVSLVIITIMSLPVNGIGGTGTLELGVSAFLISTGISKDLAINTAFNYHFINIIFIIFCGAASYYYLTFSVSRN